MLSKCANPECSRQFLHLHEGKIFHLCPTPEVEAGAAGFVPSLYERFWLCDECCRDLTVVWGGTEAKLQPIRETKIAKRPRQIAREGRIRRRRRASLTAK